MDPRVDFIQRFFSLMLTMSFQFPKRIFPRLGTGSQLSFPDFPRFLLGRSYKLMLRHSEPVCETFHLNISEKHLTNL